MSEETEPARFEDLGLPEGLVQAVAALGYEEPTPIQRAAIPVLLEGRDVLGLAATGTGKTAAFTLPMLATLEPSDPGPSALVLVPTRELAMQVARAVHTYGRSQGVRVLPVYGGQPMPVQLRALKRGVDVVVATPGRALDHLNRGTMSLDGVRYVVLDEADEMLDMGFQEDLEAILDQVPDTRQMALFSATLAKRVKRIADRAMKDPAHVEIAPEDVDKGDLPRIRQSGYLVARHHKAAALGRLLDMEAPTSAIVFCRTRNEVDELAMALDSRGYRAEALHGGMSQAHRDTVLHKLRAGNADLLVATDVAARGLDVPHLSHVVNFDVPSAPEQYVHRIGRTGRAGREGVAITLVEPRERRLVRNIERYTEQRIALERLPTVADLRARRLALIGAQIREATMDDDLDRYRRVVEDLADEFDVMDVAAAAVKALHDATGVEDDREIPEPRLAFDDAKKQRKRERKKPSFDVARVFIGLGRRDGIRPGDLFGAIANETGLRGKAIGSIEIADRFATVEVPAEVCDDVIQALRQTTLRGKKVIARRDRDER